MKFTAHDEFSSEKLAALSYETPFFLFSKQRIEKNYQAFKTYFPHASIQYALKANSEPEILELLTRAGSGFEVASKY